MQRFDGIVIICIRNKKEPKTSQQSRVNIFLTHFFQITYFIGE